MAQRTARSVWCVWWQLVVASDGWLQGIHGLFNSLRTGKWSVDRWLMVICCSFKWWLSVAMLNCQRVTDASKKGKKEEKWCAVMTVSAWYVPNAWKTIRKMNYRNYHQLEVMHTNAGHSMVPPVSASRLSRCVTKHVSRFSRLSGYWVQSDLRNSLLIQ